MLISRLVKDESGWIRENMRRINYGCGLLLLFDMKLKSPWIYYQLFNLRLFCEPPTGKQKMKYKLEAACVCCGVFRD